MPTIKQQIYNLESHLRGALDDIAKLKRKLAKHEKLLVDPDDKCNIKVLRDIPLPCLIRAGDNILYDDIKFLDLRIKSLENKAKRKN